MSRHHHHRRGLPPQIHIHNTNSNNNNRSLLLSLSESCERHSSRHEKLPLTTSFVVDTEDQVPQFCRDALHSLRKVLPKVEQHYQQRQPSAQDLTHICDFYTQVMEGGFCPHAPHLFRLGKRAVEVLPRIYFLLQNLFAHEALETICRTVAKLSAMVPEAACLQDLVQDWLHLSVDLSLLLEAAHDEQELFPVEVVLFDRVLAHAGGTSDDFGVTLTHRGQVCLLQSAVVSILYYTLLYHRHRRLCQHDDNHNNTDTDVLLDDSLWVVDMGSDYGKDDCFFRPLAVVHHGLFSDVLLVLRQVLLTPQGTTRTQVFALRLLQALMLDGDHEAVIRFPAALLVGQVVQRGLQSTTTSTSLPLKKVAACLTKVVFSSFIARHSNDDDDAHSTTLLALLAEEVSALPVVMDADVRGLVTSVLRSLHLVATASSKLQNWPSPLRGKNFLPSLLRLVDDPDWNDLSTHILCFLVRHQVPLVDLERACAGILLESAQQPQVGNKRKDNPADDASLRASKRQRRHSQGENENTEPQETVPRSGLVDDILDWLVTTVESSTAETLPTPDGLRLRFLRLSSCFRVVVACEGALWNSTLRRFLDTTGEKLQQWVGELGVTNKDPESSSLKLALPWVVSQASIKRGKGQPAVALLEQTLSAAASDHGNPRNNPRWIAETLYYHALQNVVNTSASDPIHIPSTCYLEILPGKVVRSSFDGTKFHFHLTERVALHDNSAAKQAERLRALAGQSKVDRRMLGKSLHQDSFVLVSNLDPKLVASPISPLRCVQWLLSSTTGSELRQLVPPEDGSRERQASAVLGLLMNGCFAGDAVSRDLASSLLSQLFEERMEHLFALLATSTEWRSFSENLNPDGCFDRIAAVICRLVTRQLQYHSPPTAPGVDPNSSSLIDGTNTTGTLLSKRRCELNLLFSLCGKPSSLSMVTRFAMAQIVRKWFGNDRSRTEEEWICFNEMSRRQIQLTSLFRSSPVKTALFAHAVFRGILVDPAPSAVQSAPAERSRIESMQATDKERRCLILGAFVNYFFLGNNEGRDFWESLDGDTTLGAERFLGQTLPIVLSRFVIEMDYDALRLTTMYKLFLLGQKKFETKQRKRLVSQGALLDSGADLTVGSIRSTFISSSLLSKVWSYDLEEQTGFLCTSGGLFSGLLPQVFGQASEPEITFFTETVLRNRVSLSKAINSSDRDVLKALLFEIGRTHTPSRGSLRAIKVAAHFRSGNGDTGGQTSAHSRKFKDDSDMSSVSSWVTEHFMYLVVNVVQFRWRTKSLQEKVQALRSMLFCISLLQATESSQYLPHVIATLNAAMSLPSGQFAHQTDEARFLAIGILSMFIDLVAQSNSDLLTQNLQLLVVSLIPVFSSDNEGSDFARRSKGAAVGILEKLVSGNLGVKLTPAFSEIPFLPDIPQLQRVRERLRTLGVNDESDLILRRSPSVTSKHSHPSECESISVEKSDSGASGQEALRQRLATVCPLLSHDNPQVRKVALRHIIDILKMNRNLFHALVENEGDTSMKHYLTTIKPGTLGSSRGTVTDLVEALLSRCVAERDDDVRALVATCLGEVGAIDVRNLEERSIASGTKNLTERPWASQENPALKLTTGNLVRALKAAHSSTDQHKIMFTIQQLLVLLDEVGVQNDKTNSSTAVQEKGRGMSRWLSKKLGDAGVSEVVEPFWWTEFCESDTIIVTKSPPFFSEASSYYTWMSGWCSHMVRRAYDKKQNKWTRLFHACRTALRTPVGLETAEHLLPLLLLDRLCHGDAQDEAVLLNEIRAALTWGHEGTAKMPHGEHQKVVKTLLDVIDTIQFWSELEVEISQDKKARVNNDPSWPPDECVMRIGDLMKNLPLSLRAHAAARVGMHARALRLFEMLSRSKISKSVFDEQSPPSLCKPTQSPAAGMCGDNDFESMLKTVGSLDDYDTLTSLLEEETTRMKNSHTWGIIKRKEAIGDWEGALQEYEGAIQMGESGGLDPSLLQRGALKCLLELGHFKSVLNQVSGISNSSAVRVDPNDEVYPLAVEASWRLGDWDCLENLLSTHDSKQKSLCVETTQGQIFSSLMQGNREEALGFVRSSKNIVMQQLSISASEGYTRAYPHIVKLHVLREVEDVASTATESDLREVTGNALTSTLGWKRRLDFVGSKCETSIVNARLALARIIEDPVLEGSLFLRMGKIARKDGSLAIAANAFGKSEAVFRIIGKKDGCGPARTELQMQFAKLKHNAGEVTAALRMLRVGDVDSLLHMDEASLKAHIVKMMTLNRKADERNLTDGEIVSDFAKNLLQSTRWMIEGGLKGASEIMTRFRVIHAIAPELEKGHFYFAKYVDSIMQSKIVALQRRSSKYDSSEDALDVAAIVNDKTCQRYVLLAIKHYVEALAVDVRHVYQALPRLLSLWFEFTGLSQRQGMSQQELTNLAQNQREANYLIENNYKNIPVPAFYTALPQLISRVKHPNEMTPRVVSCILRRVLTKYPLQAMWPLAWLRQSRQPDRCSAGNAIFQEASKRLDGQRHQTLLVESMGLFEWFQKLAQYRVKGNKAVMDVRPWKGHVALEEYIPPVQAALSASLSLGDSSKSRDLFPRHVPRMRNFHHKVKVMASKARPKILKTSVISADSVTKYRQYLSQRRSQPDKRISDLFDIGEISFLVKAEAKGDLRKDARVQDLNNVVNRLLASTKSRRSNQERPLRLRTFAVTCLSEETGILEWVPHTAALRQLIGKAYNPQASPFTTRRRGRNVANFNAVPKLRSDYEKAQKTYFQGRNLKAAAKLFDELCLKPHPPLLFWWFVQAFQNPNAWYEARTRFARSAAAWSAIGHVMGVGDRHTENILVDTSSGECVHVDFDCIFDKGLHLPRPEVVPFRLTKNMLDAFGPTGADGVFGATLFTAMHTLRNNRDTLLSVLEPFLKDPVIDWKKSRTQQQNISAEDRQAKEAKRSINVIDERLRGIYNLRNPNYRRISPQHHSDQQDEDDLAHAIPLSVEGQVHKMIAEATRSENLVQMYVGWMPWL